ncbi:GtrA family protein [Amycolatopsis sp.]|uniref:GtrA family protein n=1 Tax=Amycolatopsis sp. TaxID=37632 RepID=UPI002C64E8E3|nr:GtrA family protein [Amycolatopsis sp.]HVV10437.1 GtrA family protein [Amycolatopsis sp.]
MRDRSGGAPEKFTRLCAAAVRRLPFGLSAVVAPSMLGFAVINSCTFAVDLALLTLGHGVLGLPLPVSVTLAYVLAFSLSFVLNRGMNFRSHAPVGRQAIRYAVAIAVNYFAFILGLGAGLAALGMEYHLSRIVAGAAEAVFLYCALRWVVFADTPGKGTRSSAPTRGQPR